jgi:hypothetical protein
MTKEEIALEIVLGMLQQDKTAWVPDDAASWAKAFNVIMETIKIDPIPQP